MSKIRRIVHYAGRRRTFCDPRLAPNVSRTALQEVTNDTGHTVGLYWIG